MFHYIMFKFVRIINWKDLYYLYQNFNVFKWLLRNTVDTENTK